MRDILFLGGTGFLGKNVLENFENNSKSNSIRFIIPHRDSGYLDSKNCIYFKIDFTDKEAMRSLFEKYNFSEVFHFISTTVPASSNDNITLDIERNLLSTLRLLELMGEFNVRKITYLSSGGTVYGEHQEMKYQEDYLNTPNNSYGVLKLTIENYIKLYQKLYGIEYLILRVSNPFGMFHQSKLNGLINIAIRKSIDNEPIQIWGNGTVKKDYIFASDFSRVFWQLRELNCYNDVINIGSGQSYTINEIIGYIKIILPQTEWVYQDEKIFDTRHSYFSIEKLKSKTNFINTEIVRAIESTYSWEKNKLTKL
jgi:UDP-glucose 4-epimerase